MLDAGTFYWHDYETWGNDPQRDWPCQFAGVRTDGALRELGPPLVLYCRPPLDRLPQPEACLVTGFTPQSIMAQGVREAEFATRIWQELAQPDTCGAGYNSRRFDDEVTRHLFYRNFRDPYAHTWQQGNSRWDLIDTLRLAHALRPAGLNWPRHATGEPSFRLADLTAANDIPHSGAHDALADVRATIALMRRLYQVQPRLLSYTLKLRDKHFVHKIWHAAHARREPLLHVSARYPAEQGCIAPVIGLAASPGKKNTVIVFDVRQDPTLLLDLSVEELRQRLFTSRTTLSPERPRPPLKELRFHVGPIVAPLSTLDAAAAERWAIDPVTVRAYTLKAHAHAAALAAQVQAAYRERPSTTPTDPDLMLYCGGFFSAADQRERARVVAIAEKSPAALARTRFSFTDPRLPELLFRYRARNWPETLTADEHARWQAHCRAQLTAADTSGSCPRTRYRAQLAALRSIHAEDKNCLRVLDELAAWEAQLAAHAALAPST